MFQGKKKEYRYSIDKLHLKYFDNSNILEAIRCESSELFLFDRINGYLNYEVYNMFYRKDGRLCYIGVLSFKEKGYMMLEVDNRLLYTSSLDVIKTFEVEYGLKFKTFGKIELCCDSNVNLPHKLDRILHSTKYEIKRCGRSFATKNGNLRIGGKYIDNIVFLNKDKKDKKSVTYYFAPIHTRTCKKSQCVQLVGYDKKWEIEQSGEKSYILDGLAFATDSVHRLEIRTCGYEMLHNNIDIKYIYDNLDDEGCWKFLYLTYINRFFEFHYGKHKFTVSQILGIE